MALNNVADVPKVRTEISTSIGRDKNLSKATVACICRSSPVCPKYDAIVSSAAVSSRDVVRHPL
jgi:hypothetical protein